METAICERDRHEPEKNAPGEAMGIASQCLFRGRRELVIVHAGQSYRLTITRQNKLILTK